MRHGSPTPNGLHNRLSQSRLPKAWRVVAAEAKPLVLMIDVDHFKRINDRRASAATSLRKVAQPSRAGARQRWPRLRRTRNS